MSSCANLCTIGTITNAKTNTKPFTLRWGKVLSSEKKVENKDTLQQLLGKLQVSILVLSVVGLDPVLWEFLVSRLVSEQFKAANTIYILEGI